MCSKCDNLRDEIARTGAFSVGLTDPSSVALTIPDIKDLEEKLATLVAGHESAPK